MEGLVKLNLFNNSYKDKVILITGHTGFKGSWLSIWLHELGAIVIGLSLDPYTMKDNFILTEIGKKIIDIRGDIRDPKIVNEIFTKYKPEIVFHLAAQPLVRLSYKEPVLTYQTNLMGTINILEGIRKTKSVKIGVFITTDKCYKNKEQIWGYQENDPLGGYDPYSSSKGCAELAISSWRNSFFNPNDYNKHGKSIASARAGNVIGGGDWAQDRLIPDCVRSIEEEKTIEIRSPDATRPWQHVLEPLYGYLLLGKKMMENPIQYSEAWNFGPNFESIISVWDLANKFIKSYGHGKILDVSERFHPHETTLLSLNITKAQKLLNWSPQLNIDETIEYIVEWYKKYKTGSVYSIVTSQIKRYSEKLEPIDSW